MKQIKKSPDYFKSEQVGFTRYKNQNHLFIHWRIFNNIT